jgi:hypothetical protein
MFSHFVDQLERYGPMREVWMYAFESLNGYIKRLARNNSLPVPSIMNNIKRTKILRVVRGLMAFVCEESTSRSPAAVTLGHREGMAVHLDSRGRRTLLPPEDIDFLRVWMRSGIPAYGKLVEAWESHDKNVRR